MGISGKSNQQYDGRLIIIKSVNTLKILSSLVEMMIQACVETWNRRTIPIVEVINNTETKLKIGVIL